MSRTASLSIWSEIQRVVMQIETHPAESIPLIESTLKPLFDALRTQDLLQLNGGDLASKCLSVVRGGAAVSDEETRKRKLSSAILLSGKNIELSLFAIPPGRMMVPLHDHPTMHVLCKVLFGRLCEFSCDWAHAHDNSFPSSLSSSSILRCVSAGKLTVDDESRYISPGRAGAGAVHEFWSEEEEGCVFLDFFLPRYYSKPDGSPVCNYYEIPELKSSSKAELHLEVDRCSSSSSGGGTSAPSHRFVGKEFVCRQVPDPHLDMAVIKAGDEVILFFGYTQTMRPLTIKLGEEYSTREGFWTHSSFVGKPFGARIVGRHRNNADIGVTPAPFLTVLRNTPEHWSIALPHRTQIIALTDISVICSKLELRPGKIVAEAGTGSGSLTHSLARAVAPTGKVYTFDFHKVRVTTARAEFLSHGISDVVVSNWRDICTAGPNNNNTKDDEKSSLRQQKIATSDDEKKKDGDSEQEQPIPGYGLPPESVDAVFLDVPRPWDAVPNVLAILREGSGSICSYSPCIEQTQRFCEALRKSDSFFDITTVESLARELVPIFTAGSYNDRRRLRDTGLLPSADGGADNENGGGAAAAAAAAVSTASVRGFCPQNTGRGHTAFLTFAKRRRKNVE